MFQLTGGQNATGLIILITLGALVYLAVILIVQRALMLEMLELFIKALGLERRWPWLAAHMPRPTK